MTTNNAPWLSLANDGVVNAGTFDGRILGIPSGVQGFGLLYNKKIVNKIYGGEFKLSTINTRNAFKEFLEKINAAGVPLSTIVTGYTLFSKLYSRF